MDKIVKVLLWVAFAFILFSFIAPALFSRCSVSVADFSATGQIGDTIGGIMNPFVAIAGVILTFVAFYIQYKANKEQREQFFMALDETSLQEELKCRDILQLFQSDTTNTFEVVEKQCASIKEFIDKIRVDPCSEPLEWTIVFSKITKYQTIDRSILLHGFDLYVEDSNSSLFREVYNILDDIHERTEKVFKNYYSSNDLFFDRWKKDAFQLCADLVNSAYEYANVMHDSVQAYASIREEASSLFEGGVLNVGFMGKMIDNEASIFTILYNSDYAFHDSDMITLCQERKRKYREVFEKLRNKIFEIKIQNSKFASNMANEVIEIYESLEKLKEINERLKTKLEQNTPDNIRKKHKEKMKTMLYNGLKLDEMFAN